MLHKDYDPKGSAKKESVVVNLKGLGASSKVTLTLSCHHVLVRCEMVANQ
jgi:hypothetical protein